MTIETLFKNKPETQMVIFSLGNEEYAVPIQNVKEIIMLQEFTKIPKSQDFVEGVINIRGNIVPVINGNKRFRTGCTENLYDSELARIVILDIDGHILGLMVNCVSEVIKITRNQIDTAPVKMDNNIDFMWGVAKIEKRLIVLLNPEKFMYVNQLNSAQEVKEYV